MICRASQRFQSDVSKSLQREGSGDVSLRFVLALRTEKQESSIWEWIGDVSKGLSRTHRFPCTHITKAGLRGTQAQPWKVQRAQGESPSCDGLNQPCCLCLGASSMDIHGRSSVDIHAGPPVRLTEQCLQPGLLTPLQQQSRERLLLLQSRASNPWHAASMLQCLHQPGNIPGRWQTLLTEPFLAERDGAGLFTANKILPKEAEGSWAGIPTAGAERSLQPFPLLGEHGREGQAPLCAPCPHLEHQWSIQGSGDELCWKLGWIWFQIADPI